MRGKWPRPHNRLSAIAVAVIVSAVVGASTALATQDGSAGPAGSIIVKTSDGLVRGLPSTNYRAFLGIPYAAPPVGQLRFRAPQPVQPWSGVREATQFGPRCVQGTGWDPGYDTAKLTEDCLYLNVYVSDRVRRNAPVLVWIHGGGFTGGAGQDTAPRKYIDATGSIFVTINYRLGALGFLDLPQLRQQGPGAGAYGLLDQQAALRWVHENIRSFGGDPRNVTIAGQSAGGSSVCDQLSSPTARGLFDRAIIMSGSCGMSSQTAADSAGQTFVKALGCTDPATVLSCLDGKSTADILAAQQNSGASLRPAVGGTSFPEDPGTAVPAGHFTRVPVLIGQVHDERRLFVFQDYDYLGKPVTAAEYQAYVESTYGANASKVLAAYPVSDYPSPSIALATVETDAATYTRYVLEQELGKWTPTYAYEFAEEQTPQFYSIYRLQQQGEPARSFPFGATHVDDLGYLFDYVGHTLPYSDSELELSDQMIAFWHRFQEVGNPNVAAAPPWPRFGAESGAWMELKACGTSDAENQPPAACSAASSGYVQDHKLELWKSIVG